MVRERFQPALTHSLVAEHVDRLIDTSLGSHWTRLYDSVGPFIAHTTTNGTDNITVPILLTIYIIDRDLGLIARIIIIFSWHRIHSNGASLAYHVVYS